MADLLALCNIVWDVVPGAQVSFYREGSCDELVVIQMTAVCRRQTYAAAVRYERHFFESPSLQTAVMAAVYQAARRLDSYMRQREVKGNADGGADGGA